MLMSPTETWGLLAAIDSSALILATEKSALLAETEATPPDLSRNLGGSYLRGWSHWSRISIF